MTMIAFESLCFGYGNEPIIENLSYTFREGAVTGLIGASGVGKTTLIHLLCALKKPTSGKVICDTDKLAVVFQEPRLFPWMTAYENVFAVCRDEVRTRHYLDLLFPDGDSRNTEKKFPHELSGGMQQRIAIARALAYAPKLLILDEPFKGLDRETRENTADIVFSECRKQSVTCLLISHEEIDLTFCDVVLRLAAKPITGFELVKS